MNDDVELIDIARLIPEVVIDLKYATTDNLTGKVIYRENRCLLHPDAAKALSRSVEVAALAGFTLLIYDAWRPQKAQDYLWLACPDPQYVVEASLGSNHSRGTAVDVTLIDENGDVLDMGAAFDEMHERSHPFHPTVPLFAQRNRLLLNGIMFAGGFTGIKTEWWHFELPNSADYPLLSDRFGCVEPAESPSD
ncbi:D-alanyl-D-alanine dipeptidase [[Pantoea] beijingensis]|uniref:D-alanyl-D-alanine dipeptidase n=1 Tax=[Pantoea] beijingensis TaxID=1324864 RepID=A0A443IC96_9GAMM|nr:MULTISPECIES: D-alanyl-D-alanine dipeptidase [Erwiniaceae]RWR01739.1 D-alanyl-D-alanine dipeptidase [[Pantoea] beijingensis]